MFTKAAQGLIVACRGAVADVKAAALTAEQRGAVALRVYGLAELAAAKAASTLPVIASLERADGRGLRVITPDLASAAELAAAGADVIALDGSALARPVPALLAQLIRQVREELGRPVLAVVGLGPEAGRAVGYGAELVGISGGRPELISEVAAAVGVPVVADGAEPEPLWAAGADYVLVAGNR